MTARPLFKFQNDDGRRTCELYQEAIARGETPADVVRELAAMFDVQRPAIWKRLRAGKIIEPYAKRRVGGSGRPIGGGQPGYSASRRDRSLLRQQIAEKAEALAATPRVDRDPCPRCGIRADIGCKHSRAPLGMVL